MSNCFTTHFSEHVLEKYGLGDGRILILVNNFTGLLQTFAYILHSILIVWKQYVYL